MHSHLAAEASRKLHFLFLVNHILQSSRKKQEAVEDYLAILEQAVEHVLRSACTLVLPSIHLGCHRHSNEKVVASVQRLVSVWEERQVFSADLIERLKKISWWTSLRIGF
jgi:hypothetical protein